MQLSADFAAALTALAPDFGCDDRLALAVSGGGDSFGMLALAAEALPGRCVVLTVDHGLRPESAAEAEQVRQACLPRDIAVRVLSIDWNGAPPSENRQAASRTARYEAMGQACEAEGVRWLATGHQLDDQAETLLMRLQRGSGLSGLAGIRPRRTVGNLTILRPCLAMRRDDLRAAATGAGFEPVDDPSNADPAYDRTAARAFLAEHPEFDSTRLAATSAYLAEAEEALSWTVQLAFESRTDRRGETLLLDPAGLPADVLRRTILLIFEEFAVPFPRGEALAGLIAKLAKGGAATLCGLDARGGREWTFRREGTSGG